MSTLLEKAAQIEIPGGIKRIIIYLQSEGKQAFLVGGCVRDALMDKVPKDYDIATDALPEEVERILSLKDVRVIDTGKKFGVIKAILKEFPEGVDIATFSKDDTAGRRPDSVTFCSLKEDAERRDFKMNSLYLDPIKGEIIDHFGGIFDMEAGVISSVGVPEERLLEDPLRIMRALRFHLTMGFKINRSLKEALEQHAGKLADVSKERIREELVKCVQGTEFPARILEVLRDYLLEEIVFQNMYYRNLFQNLPPNFIFKEEEKQYPHLYWALLMAGGTFYRPDLGRNRIINMMEMTRWTKKEANEVVGCLGFLRSYYLMNLGVSKGYSIKIKKEHRSKNIDPRVIKCFANAVYRMSDRKSVV